jgi:molecular chaperone DnaJ
VRDLYKVLGIGRDADQATIRKAFKKLARKFHPDLNKAEGASDRFKEINSAYEVLGDEQRRNAYDSFGEASLKPGFDPGRARQWREATGGFGGGGFSGGGGGFGGVDIEEILKNFGGRQRGPSPRPRPAPTRGADIEQPLRCTIEQLIAGEGITVTIRRPAACTACAGKGGEGRETCGACTGTGDKKVGPVTFPCVACSGAGHRFKSECSTCEGTGRSMKEEHLKVRVPPGVQDGQTIRLRGKGAEGKKRGPSGDLLLAVRIQRHELFERDGSDLRLLVPLTIHEAIAGTRLKVPTLHGAIKVTIPANATSGQQMRIKSRGLPRKGGKHGDLYLVLQPSPPPSSEEALRLAADLEPLYTEDVRSHWGD